MKFLLAAFILLSTVTNSSCQPKLFFPGDDKDAKLTILSEFHGIAGTPLFKSMLTEQLYDNDQVKDLVLEMGRSAAYLYNEYIQTGDTAILNTLYPQAGVKNNYGFLLQELRRLYTMGKHIEVHGIDFERMEFMDATLYLFDKKGKTDNQLYRFITSLPDTIVQLRTNYNLRNERKKVLNDCYAIYQQDAAYYDQITDGAFSVKTIFDNPASEMQFTKRDAAMAANITPIIAQAPAHVLLVVGSAHIEDKGKMLRRMMKEAKLDHKDICIISMLCKNCEANAMYLEKKRVPYLGNKNLLADTAAANRVFADHSDPGQLYIIPANEQFWTTYGLKRDEDLDYIMLINCDPVGK